MRAILNIENASVSIECDINLIEQDMGVMLRASVLVGCYYAHIKCILLHDVGDADFFMRVIYAYITLIKHSNMYMGVIYCRIHTRVIQTS